MIKLVTELLTTHCILHCPRIDMYHQGSLQSPGNKRVRTTIKNKQKCKSTKTYYFTYNYICIQGLKETRLYPTTVKPLNSGHIGDRLFVRYLEVGLFSEGPVR